MSCSNCTGLSSRRVFPYSSVLSSIALTIASSIKIIDDQGL